MRWLIASDIHGSALYAKALFKRVEEEKADRILLLGDLLYHGPRNDLPAGYAPKEVIELLNAHKEKILCVRGNCEAEVDQMVLDFPVMADYVVLPIGEKQIIYATHGHHANEQTPPPLGLGDILLNGHTHVPKCTEHEHFTYMNPGSVSIPKEGSPRSYMIWEDSLFEWKALMTGECYLTYQMKGKT